MYVKYLGEHPTSVWNTQGRKVEITQGMIFETDKKNGKQYLNRQKSFTEATISDFESQKVKPEVIGQGVVSTPEPVKEPEPETPTEPTEPVQEPEPPAEPEPVKEPKKKS